MWCVTRRREMVTHIQRNLNFHKVLFMFVCSVVDAPGALLITFSLKPWAVLLKFSTTSPREALSWHDCIPYNNTPTPPAGCPQMHHETGLVVQTHISWWKVPVMPFETQTLPCGRDWGGAGGQAMPDKVTSPWHWDGVCAGHWRGRGSESHLWGVSQLLLLWL